MSCNVRMLQTLDHMLNNWALLVLKNFCWIIEGMDKQWSDNWGSAVYPLKQVDVLISKNQALHMLYSNTVLNTQIYLK